MLLRMEIFIIIIVIIISLWVFPKYAYGETLLVNEDFEQMQTGIPAVGEGWESIFGVTSSPTKYGTCYIEYESGTSGNKVVKVYRKKGGTVDNYSSFGYYKAGGLGFPGDLLIVDFRFKSNPHDKTKYQETISIFNKDRPQDGLMLIIIENSILKYGDSITDSEIPIPNAPTFQTGVWYNVRILFDMKNRIYSFYLSQSPITEGTEPLLKEQPCYKAINEYPLNPSNFRYSVRRDNERYSGGTTFIDDVRISTKMLGSDAKDYLTDEEFFGRWENDHWSVLGKLNYDYPGLGDVEAYVKVGDYTQARLALKNYYYNRTEKIPVIRGKFTGNNPHIYNLAKDNYFIVLSGEEYLTTFTVNSEKWYEIDVTSDFKNTYDSGYQGYILLGRNKEENIATFYSRETEKPPQLVYTYNGVTYTVNAEKDAYVRAGIEYKDLNFGNEERIEVNDSGGSGGIPYDSNTRRGYITFKTPKLSSAQGISNAKLRLYGKSESGEEKVILVLKNQNNAWSEYTINFNSLASGVFSWQNGNISWGNLPYGANVEFAFQFPRFNSFFGPILINYRNTQGEESAQEGIRLIMDFISKNSPGYPAPLHAAIRTVTFTSAFLNFRQSEALDSDKLTTILKFIWGEADYLSKEENFSTVNNHGTVVTNKLYSLAVHFPEFSDAHLWKEIANDRTEFILDSFIKPDGSYIEATTHYTWLTIDNLKGIYQEVLDMAEDWKPELKEKYHKLITYAANNTFPDGNSFNWGDSDVTDVRDRVLTYATLFNDDELLFIGSCGAQGKEPSYQSVFYPDGKEVIMRNGWNSNSMLMSIENRYGKHGHYDNLAMILYGYGRMLLVDNGRYSYDDGDGMRSYLMSTRAHNTIEIDNKSQNKSDNSEVGFITNPSFDLYEGISRAYTGFEHKRTVFFKKDEFFIVTDQITPPDTSKHIYKQNWHMLPEAEPTIDTVTRNARSNFSEGANLYIYPVEKEGLVGSIEDGKYSETVGKLVDSHYVSYCKEESGPVQYTTLLYPSLTDVSDLTVNSIATDNNSIAMSIGFPNGNRAVYSYGRNNQNKRLSQYETDAEMVYIERNASNIIEVIAFKNGSYIRDNHIEILKNPSAFTDIYIKYREGIIEISCSEKIPVNGKYIEFYCADNIPNKVLWNGVPIDFAYKDGYIKIKNVLWTKDDISFWGSNGSMTENLSGNTYIDIKINTEKYNSMDLNAIIVCALYKNNRLLKTKIFNHNENMRIDLNNIDLNDCRLKVFLLTDLTKLTPIGEFRELY